MSLSLLLSVSPAASASLARELVAKAANATKKKQTALAVVLLRGAWEIARDLDVLERLAKAHKIAGEFAEAIDKFELLLKLSPPSGMAQQARKEIARLRKKPAPLRKPSRSQVRATVEAKRAFRQGLRIAKRKKHSQALRYLRAALVLDPMLPGPYRVLGALYSTSSHSDRETARKFLLDYLRLRPGGPIAAKIRRQLTNTGLLGKIDVLASFGCEIWINKRPLHKRTPIRNLLLPPGKHVVSFVNEECHVISHKNVRVTSGKKTVVRFDFGVLSIDLKPWARVRANGLDLGLWPKIGLPAGEYHLSFEAHDSSRSMKKSQNIRGGEVVSISRWE